MNFMVTHTLVDLPWRTYVGGIQNSYVGGNEFSLFPGTISWDFFHFLQGQISTKVGIKIKFPPTYSIVYVGGNEKFVEN